MAEELLERGRISARCAKAQQDTIDTAATPAGTPFGLQAAPEKEERVIEDERRIVVSERDAAIIMAMLENPPAPNPALASLLRDYRAKVDRGELQTSV